MEPTLREFLDSMFRGPFLVIHGAFCLKDVSTFDLMRNHFLDHQIHASVTELVDVQGLGSCAARCEGSSPSAGR